MDAPTGDDSGLVRVSLTLDEMAKLKREILRERPYSDRVSFPLAVRLADMYAKREDYFPALQELDFLEEDYQVSSSVAATQFKHKPLFPLWHKHYSTARHVVRNLSIRWGVRGGGNKDLDRLIDEVAKEHGDDPDKWPAALAHRLVHEAYLERARKGEAAEVRECQPGEGRTRGLTGDWIIYGKHEGKNYYLDLATHEEEQDALYEKLRAGCAAEFPFLFPSTGLEEKNRG